MFSVVFNTKAWFYMDAVLVLTIWLQAQEGIKVSAVWGSEIAVLCPIVCIAMTTVFYSCYFLNYLTT